jgi:tetratricopeptide (TPR) repeat protein
LRDGDGLNAWLKDNGLTCSLLELLFACGFDGCGPTGMPPVGRPPLSRFRQRLWVAEHRRAKGDPEGALKACEKVLAQKPTLGYGLAVRAACKSDLGDHAEAIADCTAALRAGFLSPAVLLCRAVARDTLGGHEEAEADCDAALELEPDYPDALNSRGMIRLRRGELRGAIDDLDETVRLAPTSWLPRMGRAQALLGVSNPWGAIADFDMVIAALSGSGTQQRLLASMYGKRAKCHALCGDQTKAGADLLMARKLDPKAS